jgi:hypothetical protein
LAEERAAGRMMIQPQAFPESERFRSVRPYPVSAPPTFVT